MKFKVVLEQYDEGYYVVSCPSLPGCQTQGKSRKEALENMKEAITVYLESLKINDEPVPISIEDATIDVNTASFIEITKPLKEVAKKSGLKESEVNNIIHKIRKEKK